MKVHLFGMFAEAMGRDAVDVPAVGTVAELRKVLHALHPVFGSTPYRVAADRRMVADTEVLTETQELAALPPFSGG